MAKAKRSTEAQAPAAPPAEPVVGPVAEPVAEPAPKVTEPSPAPVVTEGVKWKDPIPGCKNPMSLVTYYDNEPVGPDEYKAVQDGLDAFIEQVKKAKSDVKNPTAGWGPSDWDAYREKQAGRTFVHPSALRG